LRGAFKADPPNPYVGPESGDTIKLNFNRCRLRKPGERWSSEIVWKTTGYLRGLENSKAEAHPDRGIDVAVLEEAGPTRDAPR
jgi:hypothetical protein